MGLDFSQIILTKKEFEILEKLESHILIPEDEDAKKEIDGIIKQDFAESYKTRMDERPCIAVRITERGKRYLMYMRNAKSQKRKETIKYAITTTISIIALITAVVSIVLQYL